MAETTALWDEQQEQSPEVAEQRARVAAAASIERKREHIMEDIERAHTAMAPPSNPYEIGAMFRVWENLTTVHRILGEIADSIRVGATTEGDHRG